MSQNFDKEPYRTVESKYISRTKWRSLREDRVDIGNGREISYSYLETPRAVFVVPLTIDGQIVLIRQYRYPVRNWVIEVPAGSLDNPEEDPAVRAREELLEEVGGECQALVHLAEFYSSSAHINLFSHVFLATGVRLGQSKLEETELLQRLVLPAPEVLAMARRGEINEGQSAYAVLLAEPHILALEKNGWRK
jgi:ADP-ribose pyrophosphatase